MQDVPWATLNIPPSVRDKLLNAAPQFAQAQEHLHGIEEAMSIAREIAHASGAGQRLVDSMAYPDVGASLGATLDAQRHWQTLSEAAEVMMGAIPNMNPMQGLADEISARQHLIDGALTGITAVTGGLPEHVLDGAITSLAGTIADASIAGVASSFGPEITGTRVALDALQLPHDAIQNALAAFPKIDLPALTLPEPYNMFQPVPLAILDHSPQLVRDIEQLAAMRDTAEALQDQNELLRETFSEERAARISAEKRAAEDRQVMREALEEARLQRIASQRALWTTIGATALGLATLLLSL